MTRIDRSRHLELLRCPRARYLGYHYGGGGLTYSASRPSIYLITGGCIHKGLESLLLARGTEVAVGEALNEFVRQTFDIKGLEGQSDENLSYTLAEQKALIEILLRLYAVRALSALLAEYEVLEVEQEYEWPLTPEITFMSRVDGLLRSRANGDLVVLSFKTDSGYNPKAKIEDHQIDLQGLTEPWAVYASLGEHKRALPMGNKMEFLIKGEWKEDKLKTRFRQQDSFLVRPWLGPLDLKNPLPLEQRLKWSYYWTCQEPHTAIASNGRKTPCPGGKTHGLGGTYERVNIWELMPMREWANLLISGQVQPEAGDPFEEVLYLPPIIYRTEIEIHNRIDQVRSLEEAVAEKRKWLTSEEGQPLTPLGRELALNKAFPQDTATCNHNFGGKCQFHRMCWPFGSFQRSLDNPEALGYTQRKPHHAGELALTRQSELVQIGGIK